MFKLPKLPGLLFILGLWSLYFVATEVRSESTALSDMRLVIDISGSMKKTDPDNLRIPASKLLLNLAKEKTRFGVWTFGQYVNMLVTHGEVDAAWRASAVDQVELINSVALYTNVGEALERAAMKQTEPDPAWDRTIVLLSDGKVDISKDAAKNEAEKTRILTKLIPKLKKAGFKIHSVALSEEADIDFLKQIALDTNGNFSLARNANELLSVFVQASDKVNEPEQVPLEGNKFNIDKAVKEFTALVFRKPGSDPTKLITPSRIAFTANSPPKQVNWFADRRYDLITVANPEAGTWRIQADLDPENRVTVVSDLSLVVKGLPDNVIEGEKVNMSMFLSEEGRVLSNPNFLRLMDISFSQKVNTGEFFEGKLSSTRDGKVKVPKDGVYSAKLGRTIKEGIHEFSINVDGKTFQRKRKHRMTVHRDVLSVNTDVKDVNGEQRQFLSAQPKAALVDLEQLTLVAQIKDPKGEKQLQKGLPKENGLWVIDVPPFGALGPYEVLIKVKGVSANGSPFELVQGPYEVDYTPVGMVQSSALPEDFQAAFDDASLQVPEIEELEPEPVPVTEKEPEPLPEPVVETVEAPVEVVEGDLEEDSDSTMIGIIAAVVGNLILIGGGLFFYLRTTKKEDAQRAEVEEEITKIQKKRTDKPAAEPVPAVQPLPIADADPLDEATVMTGIDVKAPIEDRTIAQPSPPAREPVIPESVDEAEDIGYTNEAKPLELEEDEIIELDDDFDDLDDEMDGLDDLDMMLSEQEDEDPPMLGEEALAAVDEETVIEEPPASILDELASELDADEVFEETQIQEGRPAETEPELEAEPEAEPEPEPEPEPELASDEFEDVELPDEDQSSIDDLLAQVKEDQALEEIDFEGAEEEVLESEPEGKKSRKVEPDFDLDEFMLDNPEDKDQ